MMESKLNRLFDLQRFQQNPKLKSVLNDVESRYAGVLADDDLDLVNAAGTSNIPTVNVDVLLSRHNIPNDEEEKKW